MRQSIKPFVVQRKKKWQPKREPRPLFTRDELLHAEAQEAPPDVPSLVREVSTFAVREPAPLPRRILLDLTVGPEQPEPGSIHGWNARKANVTDEPLSLEAESESAAPPPTSIEIHGDGPPHREQLLTLPAPANGARGNSRSKAKRVRSKPRQNSF